MSHRHDVNPRADKKFFARSATKTKDINVRPKIMRGGIRL